jgi:hypothetical protein
MSDRMHWSLRQAILSGRIVFRGQGTVFVANLQTTTGFTTDAVAYACHAIGASLVALRVNDLPTISGFDTGTK